MKSKWIFREKPPQELITQMEDSLGLGTIETEMLVMRGIDNRDKAREFFKPNLSDIHNPFLMKDMQKAVDYIQSVMHARKKILIYGDYDVDGTSAVALMYLYLSEIYDKKLLDFYIPDRYTEGYGVSIKGIDYAKENNFSLIISLDCGIKSTKEVDYAWEQGINFIICDHHLPDEKIPNAVAVLDPKQSDCTYPYKELSGCGVGFKLCQAFNSIYNLPNEFLYELSDLLAISIASDIVPVTGENRTLLKLGLKYLKKTKKLGIENLIPKERLEHFTTSNIVFEIAPKINAAGRLSHGKDAVKLMISNDEKETSDIVQQILALNDQRKEIDQKITESAIQQVFDTKQDSHSSIVVYDPQWSKGIIGIVASRLTDKFHKPALVCTDGNNGEIVASARSVSDFDIHHALEQCSDLLLKFGGHRAAAGLTLKKEDFPAFKKKLEKTITENIEEHQRHPSIEIDSIIPVHYLTDGFFRFLKKLAPFGPHNMKPILVVENISAPMALQKFGKKEKDHIKFFLPTHEKNIECVGYSLGEYLFDFQTKKFDIAFSIEENHWRGNISHYLHIRDVRFHQ